ncbi:putative hemin receptor [Pedobacter sp. BAL39]|uniref:OmpP1/FadL family transporter n=1 Tax=Pedobacter sp. BAL39 TaxID=391596 RepID=UPI000155AC57|nr:outer membrane protein transport protein [Pedobacter sp. BAL39]EDM34455.1 putative hemin receptor [Pedobacter sp. BAL39]
MKKLLLSVVATVATIGTSYAQYVPDAARFSQNDYGSSARFKGMGGAQIGVGGDMSSLSANPAGLGLFTKSEFSFTPEFNMMKGKANYLGETTNSDRNSLNINNLGVVFYNPTYKVKGQDTKTGVLSTVFGIGYSRHSDYRATFKYQGQNTRNSIVDHYVQLANDNPNALPDGYPETMAFDGLLYDYNEANDVYTSAVTGPNLQSKREVRAGSTSEVNLAGALNISNQFYVGASLNFVNSRYDNVSEFTESGTTIDTGSPGYSLSLRQNQETRGNGVNARIGMIFRPVSNFRVGATLETPTWMLVEDNTSIVLDSRIESGPTAGTTMPDPGYFPFSYRLRTPLKGSFGASYVIGNRALLSADIDYIDYSTMHFSIDQNGDESIINSQNNEIRNTYKEAVNYRFGGEFKVDDFVSLRAGYGFKGSPVDGASKFETNYYTGGIGYRVKNYFVDAAFQRVQTNTELAPYVLDGPNGELLEPVADIKTSRNNVFLTFGVRF